MGACVRVCKEKKVLLTVDCQDRYCYVYVTSACVLAQRFYVHICCGHSSLGASLSSSLQLLLSSSSSSSPGAFSLHFPPFFIPFLPPAFYLFSDCLSDCFCCSILVGRRKGPLRDSSPSCRDIVPAALSFTAQIANTKRKERRRDDHDDNNNNKVGRTGVGVDGKLEQRRKKRKGEGCCQRRRHHRSCYYRHCRCRPLAHQVEPLDGVERIGA